MATNYAVAPGEFLYEWIEEEGRGITQAQLAEQLGVSRKLVNEILKGKSPISPETAVKLGRVTSISSSAWLLYEAQYQNDLARIKDEQQLQQHEDIATAQLAKYLRKLGVSKATLHNKTQVLSDFLAFAQYGNYEAYMKGCSAKLGPSFATLRESNQPFDKALMMAWLAAGERTPSYAKAFELTFDKAGLLRILPKIKTNVIAPNDNTLSEVIGLLESVGVVCQFIEPPEKFPLYGVVIWTRNGVPVIQLTGRRKKNCHVIWALFHELGHILHDDIPTTQLEFTKSSGSKRGEEKAANQFARDWLIGGSARDYYGMTHAEDIKNKALRNNHVPCIVIQELHRAGKLRRSWGNELIYDIAIPFQE